MLTLLTLNINADVDKHGAWPVRKSLIARAIVEAQPDVVALQAVLRRGGSNQAQEVMESVSDGYRGAYFEPSLPDAADPVQGLAFISRAPVVESQAKRLTWSNNPEDPNRRMVFRAALETARGRLQIFNTHFSWVDALARKNIDEACDFIFSFRDPAILVGDFNQTPDSPLLARLRDAGWVDAWQKLRPNEPGATFESNEPKLRIDYVWANRQIAPSVQSVQIVRADDPHRLARMSDHLGLTVRLA